MQEHVRIVQDVAMLLTSGSDLVRAEARRSDGERAGETKVCSRNVQDQSVPSVKRISKWPGRRILEGWMRGLLDEPPVNGSLKTENPEASSISIICLSFIL